LPVISLKRILSARNGLYFADSLLGAAPINPGPHPAAMKKLHHIAAGALSFTMRDCPQLPFDYRNGLRIDPRSLERGAMMPASHR
jgi:hypothetical protein